ncbi:unnamed protein product [Heterobilharzia americana]|nr:unnamed protein product [Heterobilharzia americana]
MLKLVIFISLILEEEVKSSKRLQIYFPLTWTKVRKNFGIPISVKYISLSQMYYWTSDWSNEKKGYWIPDSFKTICSPEATYKSFLDMIYEFTQEDYDKRYSNSLRNYFTRTGKYYDGGYLNILSFLVNICQCLRQRYTHLHCPNPCYKPNICYNDENSNGLCIVISSDEPIKLLPTNVRVKLGSVYAYDYECACIHQHVFNHTLKKCVPVEKKCDSSVCFNDGICKYVPKEERIIPDIEFSCICPPAWKGLACIEPRNPCLETQGLCGQHYCYRDPTISSTKPQCVNINECIEYSDEVCLNGGICIDKEPSSVVSLGLTEPNLGYICLCRDGYSGSRCERRISLIEWTTWSAWTECSVKCGIGFHTRFRSCPLPNHCTGSHIQTGRCQGPVFQCYDENDEEIPELSQSGWKILKSWGIEWHPDDGHSLNDAFYWNEADDDWGSLHYTHPGTVNLFDILEWTQALQLTRKWTIRELIVFHSIILAVLFTPLCLIVFGLAKMIQRVLYAKRIRLRR